MMRRFIVTALIVLMLAVFATPAALAQQDICGTIIETDLTAGQTMDVGSVFIWNDADTLYVRFVTTHDWYLSETHVHVATNLLGIPTSGGDAPVPGLFDYQALHTPPVQHYTFAIPLGTWGAGDALIVATHAAVVQLDDKGAELSSETAWGGNQEGPGKRWWFYFVYNVQPCDEQPPVDGDQGCTPGYWRQPHHYDSWAGYDPMTPYNDVFGVGSEIPLAGALMKRGGGMKALLRHSTAALLNAASLGVDYPYTVDEVIAMVQEAFATENWSHFKNLFADANEAGCPLN